jgi:RND superfamily putative drug exporter
VGLLAAVVVLLVAFGSVVAMGLPIVTALLGIGVTAAAIGVVARLFTTPSFTGQVAVMIGIGVGIDYALLIVTRYREALHRLGSPEPAVIEAITTAGRAVTFAGCTVMLSLLGMFLMGLPYLRGLAVGTSLAVAVAVAAAVTLLPALLGFLGSNVDRWRVGRRRRASRRSLWARWAAFVQRRPWPLAVGGLAVLLLAAVPVVGMRLGSADQGNDPKGSTTRTAFDMVAQGFGPGTNGPVMVVADIAHAQSAAPLARLQAALVATPGVAQVSGPVLGPSGRVALLTVMPTSGPQDGATVSLLHRLRADVLPEATAGSGLVVHVGGETAANVDFAHVMSERLPLFFAGVLTMSFLLLLVVFRSVLVPLKAVAMNLLSIGAAYGAMVAVFQWGKGGRLIGVSGAPIEAWAPMMLFAITFGLSMDYEVFLLSSIKERYDATGDNGGSVASGLASTARVITAAATVMVVVFGTFLLSSSRSLKEIGLGLALAIAVDATVVRIVLVPATMELLGKANWWLPGWLGRRLPAVHQRPSRPVPEAAAEAAAGPATVAEPDRVGVGG